MVFTREELERSRKINKKRRRIIVFSSVGLAVLLLAFFGLYQFTDVIVRLTPDLSSAPQSGEWTMFRHDLARTGSTGADNSPPAGQVKWTFATDGPIHSSPAVVSGVVYVGSRDGNIYAINADTGAKIWSVKTGSWVESSPVVVSGTVYFGSNDGYFYALDARTGETRWTYKTTYSIRSSAAVANGVVYFGSDDYYIYALNAATGKKIWAHKTDTQVTSSPAVAKGVVVIGSTQGILFTLNANKGKTRLAFETNTNVNASPTVNGSTGYFTDSSGYLYAVDILKRNWPMENTLKIYWKILWVYRAAPRPPPASGYIWSYKMGPAARQTSSIAVYGDRLYLGAGNDLLALDAVTQQPAWTFTTTTIVSSSPAVTDRAVYFGGQDSRFYALDRAAGKELWEITTGGQITSSPAIADGVIYVGSHDGKLYAIQ
jgi:outer membrane protein assembly factor BamB